MKRLDKNILLAKFIAEDVCEFEILLPKYGWYDTRLVLKNEYAKPITELNFDEDWNKLMLVGSKLIDFFQNQLLLLADKDVRTQLQRNVLESQIDNIVRNIGCCQLKNAFEFLVEKIQKIQA